jgi:hypothetical protein
LKIISKGPCPGQNGAPHRDKKIQKITWLLAKVVGTTKTGLKIVAKAPARQQAFRAKLGPHVGIQIIPKHYVVCS